MAKKEKEMPKEQVITLFDKEYKESELSDEQKKTQTKSEPKTFKEAFRRARQEGKAKFTYKGKSYAAVTQDEVNKAFKAGKIKKKTLRAYLNMKKKK